MNANVRKTREECEIGWCAGVRWVTLHDATLTVSNDESPYFHSSPLPYPVAVPEACRLGNKVKPSSTAPAPPLAPLPLNGGPRRLSLIAQVSVLTGSTLKR
ncbi:hypothetical protein T12_9891 [Trichinella patagoniensis]|uniref:Uncharacterized protein n=2 Tax=Trichinella TaxID=6333 RepID=A0A0V0T513_9BILA|nr:hypothetical protein T05_698 [Trichinella murrelli]KRX35042.1 hypothetical protein T05_10059 [Trichinella murrelli]KRY08182.1 hypothetical protein T12_9891 [Trichinella patagoniensis]